MLIINFAKQRNVPVYKVKKLCQEIFKHVPQELSDEQIKALDSNLNQAALALTSASGLTNASEDVRITFDVIGQKYLRQNIELFKKIGQDLARTKALIDYSSEQMENYALTRLGESYEKITNVISEVHRRQRPIDFQNLEQYISDLQADIDELNKANSPQ